MRAWLLSLAMLSAAFVAPARTEAQNPYDCIEELSDEEVISRIDWLDGRFQANKRQARAYFYGMVAMWASITVFQTVLAVNSEEPPQRFPNTLGAVGAGLMTLQTVAIPYLAALAPQRFRRHASSTPEERRARLRYGLELMETSASRAWLARGTLAHLTPVVWSGFWSTYLSIRFRDPWTTLRMVGGGLLLTGLKIYLSPQQTVRDWENAQNMMCGNRYVPTAQYRFEDPRRSEDTERVEPDEAQVEPANQASDADAESADPSPEGSSNASAGDTSNDLTPEQGPQTYVVPSGLGVSLYVFF